MFDVLPRLDILNSSNFHIDYYILNSEKQFQKESIEILDLIKDKIISPQSDTHIMADNLVIPSLPGEISYMTLRSCEFLRTKFMKSFEVILIPYKKIYITRNDALTRRVVNEQEVVEELTKIGFEIFSLEGNSIVDQARLFSIAKMVVPPHGAGLTNLVFCNEGSRVIEFMPSTYNNLCFQRLSGLRNLKYSSLISKTISTHSNSLSSQQNDHLVDLKQLLKLIEED